LSYYGLDDGSKVFLSPGKPLLPGEFTIRVFLASSAPSPPAVCSSASSTPALPTPPPLPLPKKQIPTSPSTGAGGPPPPPPPPRAGLLGLRRASASKKGLSASALASKDAVGDALVAAGFKSMGSVVLKVSLV
jgi:neural Wiskott-Aldrich syndrome protein